MRESRLSGSEGGVAPMGHPYPYGRRDAYRYGKGVTAPRFMVPMRDSRIVAALHEPRLPS